MLSNDDKKFIVQSVENGYRVSDLARMFNVTPRRIQQILKEDPSDAREQKKTSSLSDEDAKEIENLWNNYKIGSRTIFYLLKSRGRPVSYYQVYNFMRTRKMVKQKQPRTVVNSISDSDPPLATIFMDYHQTSMESPYAVVCVDMVTRKILALKESRKITKDVLEEVVGGVSEFTEKSSLKVNRLYMRSGVLTILYGATDLKYFIRKKGIDHVESDKNGQKVHLSLSRLWQNYDKFRWSFSKSDNFVYWYNNRPVVRFENRVTTPNEIMQQYIVDQQPYASSQK